MEITEIKSNQVRTFEVSTVNQKYYLEIQLNDENQIIKAYIKNPLMCNLSDLNVLKGIIIKLERYNWEN